MKNVKNINWRDGKLWAGLISLGIVLVQQIMVMFGFTYPVDWQNVIGIINTVLTILGMLGVISDTTAINNPKGDNNVESKK
ncbi:phage holin [Pediococcus acidilactici]|uniref:phage holin n=1 Tax=Pediococcus acidilactici TaxID=1254 RepID=UPI00032710E4|nr:phage holin [Pediococcus acidilactici]EOA09448.1 holin, phage phi LC3 family [Pediococcus acidilactici D3]MBW4796925.1 holin [Pediococcus acidilactici]MBW9306177.1 holin [Pediococcus acidilactici]MCE5961401.1 holin [Pediococcus acidilactici]MCW8082330.1 phage holin family protein [Pediococcus acidilactici]